MHFWFVHSGEVSLREQLATQITFAIASGELTAGQRLASTREMARRYSLHPNTVSAAYQQLQEEGLLDRRPGSGMYVRQHTPTALDEHRHQLDRMIAGFLTAARAQGFSTEVVTERARRWMEIQPPDQFLLVEPEEERQEIVLAELRPRLRLPLRVCDFEAAATASGCIALALPSKAAQARTLLPAHIELVTLQVTGVPPDLHTWITVPDDTLLGIASRWPGFVKIARTMLLAAGFDAEALVERTRGTVAWSDGLQSTAAVVCDMATAQHLSPRLRAVIFPLVSEVTLAELTRLEDGILSSLGDAT